jgi:cytidylate kinase
MTSPGHRALVVALDGPASSGKSSVGAAAAQRLGYRFCDTGLLYRAVTWLALRRGIASDDAAGLVALLPEVRLIPDDVGRLAHVSVDDVDVTTEVRGPDVDVHVSDVARVAELRAALLEWQRRIAADGGIIMAGRDIGTVVLPDADLKIYLDASAEERARRRARERGLAPGGPEERAILEELRARDRVDSTRAVAPLRTAADAIVLRTDGNEFDETVDLVVATIRDREASASASAPSESGAEDASTAAAARASRPTGRASRSRGGRVAESFIASRITPLIGGFSLLFRILIRLVGRVRIEGDLSAIPATGPLIVASNHTSSADPVLVGSFLNKQLGRPLNWLAKRELLEIPVFGFLARRGGIHPVDRSRADVEAFRTASRILEAGQVLAVFPEGTRSPDGRLQEAKDGVAILAMRSGAPILPVAVVDSDRFWPKGRWLPRFGGSVTVRFGTPFRLDDEDALAPAGPSDGDGRSRRRSKEAATRRIMGRIAELLPSRQRGVYADAVRSEVAPD